MQAMSVPAMSALAPALLPLKHRALSSLGLAVRDTAAVAARQWTVAPAVRTKAPPAIYLQSDLSLVTATGAYGTLEDAFRDLLRIDWDHGATRAYLLKNASIVDGRVYCGRWKGHWMPGQLRDLFGAAERVDSGSLACTWMGNLYFGHWLVDDLPLHLAAEVTGYPLITERTPYTQEPDYRRMLGLAVRSVRRAQVRELVIHDDFGQNLYRTERYRTLRARVSAQVGPCAGKPVMLVRGSTGTSRALVNETEIADFLRAQGFLIASPEHTPLPALMDMLAGSPLVVGVEGSHMTHALYGMAEGGTLCTIQPPNRFVNVVRSFTSCVGLRYATVVGELTQAGFALEVQKLQRILERINP
jgi:capsular polysaccharide biosynthesis protein